jgi:lipoprotein-anchoring transpeptidase ErfK/SrfK
VGVVWMQLSKENYGIHGTATPQTIGYEASHGCIRLTNWDAATLARHVKRGVRVEFTNQATAANQAG